jgi:2-polyprenyl-3-methyl-5-hydroxy-6-metoxy-1,4-benzoquinol methylase
MKVHKKKLRFRLLRRLFYSLLLKKFFAKAKRILDVGCGEGEFLSSYATHKKVCIGLDINIELTLKVAKKYQNMAEIAVIVTDMFHMPFRAKSFDVIFYSHVIEHVTVREAIQILSQFSKIASIVVIITPSYHRSFWTPGHITPYTMKTLAKILTLAGFHPLLVTYDKAFILNLPPQVLERNKLIASLLNNIPISFAKLNLLAIGASARQ